MIYSCNPVLVATPSEDVSFVHSLIVSSSDG